MATFTVFDVDRHHVYALLCQDEGGPGYIKFGRSRRIGQRLSELRVACPIPARYFATAEMPGEKLAKEVERALHRQFAVRRVSGEWYRFDFDSPEDKKDFNDGCKLVFSATLRDPVWWDKVSVEALDAAEKERKKAFMKLKDRDKIMRRAKYAAKSRQAHKELAGYGS